MSGHPCEFNATVLRALAPVIVEIGLPVHDPFAGAGTRLGQLCDRLDVVFTGTEIEGPFIVDKRVLAGNSAKRDTYPDSPFTIVTSPVYPNGMTDHQRWSPDSRWRWQTYRHGLARITGRDRPLDPENMGRYGNAHRRSQAVEDTHFDIARRCVRYWGDHALVNVKDVQARAYSVSVTERWADLLHDAGYRVEEILQVPCPGNRNGRNRDLRADHESVLIAHK